jgi:hypothetical protein
MASRVVSTPSSYCQVEDKFPLWVARFHLWRNYRFREEQSHNKRCTVQAISGKFGNGEAFE